MSPAPRYLHVARARTVLEDSLRGSKPTDQLLDSLFRSHKEMGKRDRAAVSGMVYGVLRDVGRLQALAGPEPGSWLARHLADAGHAADTLRALDLPNPAADTPVPASARANLPQELYERLVQQLGEPDAETLAAALNQPAPTDLRVNTLKTTRQAVLNALQEQGIAAQETALSPWGLRLEQRLTRQSPLLLEGHLEPQDEGSQLLALLTAAAPGETVIDWCAGAGGKSLAMAAMMQNHGRLIACDIGAARLAKIPTRAARAGVDLIETRLLGDTALPALDADVVLVDAPCSGTGTLRRSPELRLRHFDYSALAATQLEILTSAAQQVRPGGRLVYATCSLLSEENEAVVAAFLRAHPHFAVHDAPTGLPAGLRTAEAYFRVWPHRQGCDGFFAARLQRQA